MGSAQIWDLVRVKGSASPSSQIASRRISSTQGNTLTSNTSQIQRIIRLVIGLAVILLAMSGISHAGDVFYPTGSYITTDTDLKVAARSVPMVLEEAIKGSALD